MEHPHSCDLTLIYPPALASAVPGLGGGKTPDKLAILEGVRLLRVAVITSKGDPFVVPVRFHYDGNAVYFSSKEGSPLVLSVRANRRVALVADLDEGQNLRGVVIQGLAQIVRGEAEIGRVAEALGKRYPKVPTPHDGSIVKVTPVRVLDLTGREL